MQAEREAPFRRISVTTGTTEQLHRGMGTPIAALVATELSLSFLNHFRISCRLMNTCNNPDSNKPSNNIGARSRNDFVRKSKKPKSIPIRSIRKNAVLRETFETSTQIVTC